MRRSDNRHVSIETLQERENNLRLPLLIDGKHRQFGNHQLRWRWRRLPKHAVMLLSIMMSDRRGRNWLH